MRKVTCTILAVSGFMALAGQAPAADMPTKAPPVTPPVVQSWTGFYIGGHVGGGAINGDLHADYLSTTGIPFGVVPTDSSVSASGFLGGVQGGFNWQFAPMWVAGIEGDFSWTRMNASVTVIPVTPAGAPLPAQPTSWTRDLKWLASARARLGYLATPDLLVYGTGGVAFGGFDYDASFVNTAPGSNNWSNPFSKTLTGFVVGGGVDWRFAPHWALRGEYLFYHFPSTDNLASNPVFPTFPIRFTWDDTDVHVGRVALSYQFN